jgi:hypothetical protein
MEVKVIGIVKRAAIVEYFDNGTKHRCIIPEESLGNGNVVRDELLSASIPYGVDWEFQLEGVIGKATPELIAEEFHKVGIWTAEDVMNNSKAVQGVLQTVYGYDFAGIINIAKSLLHK